MANNVISRLILNRCTLGKLGDPCERCIQEAAKVDRLVEAGIALQEKMSLVQDSEEYMAVWASAQHHRGPYRGGTWEVEYLKLTAALREIELDK